MDANEVKSTDKFFLRRLRMQEDPGAAVAGAIEPIGKPFGRATS